MNITLGVIVVVGFVTILSPRLMGHDNSFYDIMKSVLCRVVRISGWDRVLRRGGYREGVPGVGHSL